MSEDWDINAIEAKIREFEAQIAEREEKVEQYEALIDAERFEIHKIRSWIRDYKDEIERQKLKEEFPEDYD